MVFNELFASAGGLIGKFLSAFIVAVFSYIIIKGLTAALSRFGKRSALPDNVISLINKIITYFIAFISLILILDNIFNFNVATFVASFGIAGLIIGIGANRLYQILLPGFSSISKNPLSKEILSMSLDFRVLLNTSAFGIL
jgi:small-conductance mechanosensitive channel